MNLPYFLRAWLVPDIRKPFRVYWRGTVIERKVSITREDKPTEYMVLVTNRIYPTEAAGAPLISVTEKYWPSVWRLLIADAAHYAKK